MTLQATNTLTPLFWMPGCFTTSGITSATLQIKDAGDKWGGVFIAPRTETLDVIAMRTSTVTLGGLVTLQFESIDLTNGRPNGTVGNTITYTTTTGAAGLIEISGCAANLTAGTPYGVTATHSTGDATFVRDTDSANTFKPFPYAYQFIDGASHALTRTNDIQIAIGRSATDYIAIPGFVGPCTAAATSFSTAGTDEPAMIFNLPFKSRLAGVHMMATQANDFTVKAYSSPLSTPALLTGMSLTVDAQVQTATTHFGYRVYLFPAEIDLNANTDYAVSYVAGASSNLLTLTYADADILKCVTGNIKGYGVQRDAGAGDFTEIGSAQKTLPAIVPLFSKFDDGAGGGFARTLGVRL